MQVTHSNYFDIEVQQHYMSASQYKSFQSCEAAAMAEFNGHYYFERTTDMMIGSYVDAWFDGTIEEFKTYHPEIFTKTGDLRAEFRRADVIIERLKRDPMFMEFMSGQSQVILTGEIGGVPFRGKVDSLHADKIVDLKIMRSFETIWDSDARERVPFPVFWGYDVQGAIYRELHRQQTGEALPFFLAAATKETETDLEIISIPDDRLDTLLEEIKYYAPHYQAIKLGLKEPTRCGHCNWCRRTKVLTAPVHYMEVGV